MLSSLLEAHVAKTEQLVRKAVVKTLSRTASGQPASMVLNTVVGKGFHPREVRRQLRALLESGQIAVGHNLNLVVRKDVGALTKKAG
jgi:hypothetical protein